MADKAIAARARIGDRREEQSVYEKCAKDVAALRKVAMQNGTDVGCTLLQPVLQPGEIRGHPGRRVVHHGKLPLKGDAALLLGRERGQERVRRGV